MYKPRILNGYKVIYKPDHHAAMHGSGYNGFVYEHIYEAELMLGRPLNKDEVVHHLDLNRSNNTWSNLLVLSRSMHSKLHSWLNSCDLTSKGMSENGKNSVKAKYFTGCQYCGKPLKNYRNKFCSVSCAHKAVMIRPDFNTLKKLLLENGFNRSKVGRIFNVTSSAVRKWISKYKLTPSRVCGTPQKGVETSGEV